MENGRRINKKRYLKNCSKDLVGTTTLHIDAICSTIVSSTLAILFHGSTGTDGYHQYR